jgi:hypothetical protein
MPIPGEGILANGRGGGQAPDGNGRLPPASLDRLQQRPDRGGNGDGHRAHKRALPAATDRRRELLMEIGMRAWRETARPVPLDVPLTPRGAALWAIECFPLSALLLGVEGFERVLRQGGLLADREVADAES